MNVKRHAASALSLDGTDEGRFPYNKPMFRFDERLGRGAFCPFAGGISRLAMLVPMFVLAVVASGQGDRGSLTEQFPNMSAKERSRIAEREQSEASKDQAYQEIMRRADEAFRSARYEEALKGYEEARSVRPYNVYPKVKIEDIRALLAKRTALEPSTSQDTAATAPPVNPDAAPAETPAPVVRQAPPVESPGSEPAPTPVPPEAIGPPQRSVPPAPAVGVIERRYKEGHAHVIERVVSVEGRTVIYKRVFHAWGQVFYFEDGKPVDERVWNARFPR